MKCRKNSKLKMKLLKSRISIKLPSIHFTKRDFQNYLLNLIRKKKLFAKAQEIRATKLTIVKREIKFSKVRV